MQVERVLSWYIKGRALGALSFGTGHGWRPFNEVLENEVCYSDCVSVEFFILLECLRYNSTKNIV